MWVEHILLRIVIYLDIRSDLKQWSSNTLCTLTSNRSLRINHTNARYVYKSTRIQSPKSHMISRSRNKPVYRVRTRTLFITLKVHTTIWIHNSKNTSLKSNIEMYHFINTFWTHIFCLVWGPFYDEYTSLPKGHHKNQGLNITIIMLVNVQLCGSNHFFLSLRPLEIISNLTSNNIPFD